GQAVIALGFCTESHVTRALAEQMEMPFVDLVETPPTPKALHLVPRKIAMEFGVIPVRLEGERLLVAARNPLDFRVDDAIRKAAGMPVLIACGVEGQLTDALDRYDQLRSWTDAPALVAGDSHLADRFQHHKSVAELSKAAEESGLIETVNTLVADALRKQAVEIHFDAQEDALQIRCRIDGDMIRMAALPRHSARAVIARLKNMSGMELWDDRRPQKGTCEISVEGKLTQLLATSLPGAGGETLILKLANPRRKVFRLEEMELAPETSQDLNGLLAARRGLLVVASPAGAGKTTTLYSILARLNAENLHVVTVEHSASSSLPGVRQLEVSRVARQSPAALLDAALQGDPDVVMVEDLADADTAEMACRAALAGRMVLASVPTATVLGALARLQELGVPPRILGGALAGVLAQRLARRVCDACAEPCEAPAELAAMLPPGALLSAETAFRRGKGCDQCLYRGTRGRVAVQELLVADEDLRSMLAWRALPSRIQEHIGGLTRRTLEQDAAWKVQRGLISPEELAHLGR
ncbi:MAG TPA: ATPase, T2SS/T4P/T4SS family, partial [Armatimonadota bacterium]|nr:ATPase, T2SS/T4P/T4SS family [Armatimonadota bacterium]